MYTTTTIIHYNRHLVLRQEFGKYKWRGKEFDTEEQAFNAIDDKITHFKNKNMEQNKFEWTDALVAEYSLKEQKMTLYEFKRFIAEREASKTKPKEYEILEFSVDYLGDSNIVFYKLTEPNVYRKKGTDFPIWFDILNTQKEKSFKIKRVRRLSDGEVFSIGDEVVVGVRKGVIGKFISAERLQLSCVDCEPCYNLSELQKAKQPILTTTDGVDVYENTSIWILFEQTWRLSNIPSCKNMHQELTSDRSANTYKYFSTKEAAEQYVHWNKKQFSLADIMAYSEWYSGNNETEYRKFSTDFLKRQIK